LGATLRAGDRIVLGLTLSLIAVSLTGCDSGEAHPAAPKKGIAVRLVLVPDGSDGCCGVLSVNDEVRAIRVFCELTAFDADGRLIYAGLVPHHPPGERRNPMTGEGGFLVPPGRYEQPRVDLPIDLARDTYRSKCRVATWHGAPPL